MHRFSLLPLLLFCWASASALTPPPATETAGGETLFLLFSLDAPDDRTVRLTARFPSGFELLSAPERDVTQGDNLLPVSVSVAGTVRSGRYDLCLGVEGDVSEACVEVWVIPREGLTVRVPSEVFGPAVPLTLSSEGNRPQVLAVRAAGEVKFAPRTFTLAPGETRTLKLALTGTGTLELYVNSTLYLVAVKSLDGLPPPIALVLRAANTFDFTGDRLEPSLIFEGPISDNTTLSAQLSGEPFAQLTSQDYSASVGRLPDLGDGVRLGYGAPWGGEAFYGFGGAGFGGTGQGPVVGGGVTYRGAAGAGRLRLFYDGEVWVDGGLEGLEFGDWRANGRVGRQELSADLASAAAGLEFGVRYDYAGPLLLEVSLAEGERARQGLTLTLGAEPSASYRLDVGQAALTATTVWAPVPRFDWQLGFGERLGPGRYTAVFGVRREEPTLGASYALTVPWVPELTLGASAQLADVQASGTLSYLGFPWRADLRLGTQTSEASVSYEDDLFLLSLEARADEDFSLALKGQYTLSVGVPEAVVETFGGRRWARLVGRVRVENGRGLPGVVIDAGENRVKTGVGGHYTLWLPPGAHTLRLSPDTLPLETIAPPVQTLSLAEFERRALELVVRPAGAVSLLCTGAVEGVTGVGLSLLGLTGGSLVYCGQSVGGLPAGRYRLLPVGLRDDRLARHPGEVTLQTGATRQVTMALRRRPPPKATRPTLTLRAEPLLVAAPGERVSVTAESNASEVAAFLPTGEQVRLARSGEGRFSGYVELPFAVATPLYTVRLVAQTGAERLERQALIQFDPTRPLFEASFDPVQAAVGETVTVTVAARFSPRTVRLEGPGVTLRLALEDAQYTGRFEVPESWKKLDEVTLTLTLEGTQTLTESYRFRLP